MALNPLRGTQLYIKVGDGATPTETFTHPCLINTKRGITFSSNANKVIVPDCDNPDDPAWNQVIKDALSAAIAGAGTLNTDDVAFYDAWFRSPNAKNVQVWLGTRGYWQGAFQLTGWAVSGDRNVNSDVTISLESHGALNAFVAA